MSLTDELQIPLKHVLSATNDFADENLILSSIINVRRKRRNIKIYKARLEDVGGPDIPNEGSPVFKKLIDVAIRRYHGLVNDEHLMIEVGMLSRLKHKNIISVFGFCYEYYEESMKNEQIIIYRLEYSSRSLSTYLGSPILTWKQRLQICIGIASALQYMHKDMNVIHCNISSSVILLDENWEAKLIGFEFSEDDKNYLHNSNFRFHPGTVDPIAERTLTLTSKSDVYSFGILLVEILCTKNINDLKEDKDFSAQSLVSPNNLENLDKHIHPDLRKEMCSNTIEIFTRVAYDCLRGTRENRPDMDQILRRLKKLKKAQQHGDLRIPLCDIREATKNFDPTLMIDKGGFGEVYKAKLKGFSDYVAVKSISKRDDGRCKEGFNLEIDILDTRRHPNIISLLGLCEEDSKMILVYEYAHNLSLKHVLRDNIKKADFNWVKRIKVCLDIASGLNYLHSVIEDEPTVIHLDIKSGNILIGLDWEAKIADFGLSVIRDEGNPVDTITDYRYRGTSAFVEPEYKKEKTFNEKSDIYSLGVVLFEIFSGNVATDVISPVKNDNGGHTYLIKGSPLEKLDPMIEKGTYDTGFTSIEGPNKKSLKTFRNIANLCLEKRAKRPTMKVIISKLSRALLQAELKISSEDIKVTQDFGVKETEDGKLYRAELSDDDDIREKVLIKHVRNLNEFTEELEILSKYEHKNIIGLVGYCDKGDKKIIVYEDVFRGTLDQYINNSSLSWTQRLQICIDVVTGLNFLHNGYVRQGKAVVHNDEFRSTSIVITNNWEAKISNFGNSFITNINKPPFHHAAIDILFFGYFMVEILTGSRLSDEYLPQEPILVEGIKKVIVPESLDTFLDIAKQCLSKDEKPTAHEVIIQLEKALVYQANLKISFKDIKVTHDFGVDEGELGKVCRAELSHDDDIREKVLIKPVLEITKTFFRELYILVNYVHKNIIGLVGYCDEDDKRIIVYEDVFRGTLDKNLDELSLCWTQRLKICIDVARGLNFLHSGDVRQGEVVVHGDIRSTSIVITNNWEAKISNFGDSFISHINDKPRRHNTDIQSFGYVMFEILSGSRWSGEDLPQEPIVFDGIKKEIVPESLDTFLDIAKQCLSEDEKPTAQKVIIQLEKALEYQSQLIEKDKKIMPSTISSEEASHMNLPIKKFETGKHVEDQDLSPFSRSSTIQNSLPLMVIPDLKATTLTPGSKQKFIDRLKHEVVLGLQQKIVLKEEIKKIQAENKVRLALIRDLENDEI